MTDREADAGGWRLVYAIAVVLVLIAFLYTVRSVLNPFLLYLLLLLLMAPFAGSSTYVLVVTGTGLLTAIWLLQSLGSLLAPFFLGLAIAYLIYPLVRRIEGRRIPRSAAIGLISLPVVGAVVAAFLFGIPALSQEITRFVEGIPAYLQSGVRSVERMQLLLARRDLPFVDEDALLEQLRTLRPEAVMEYVQTRQNAIARQVWQGVLGAGRGLSVALTILSYILLAPILAFYLLRDYEKIVERVGGLVPEARRPRVAAFAREYDHLLSSYVRGQMLEAAAVGVLTWLGFWLLDFPYALLLGVTAGVFNLIPYLGLVVTFIPAILIALFSGDVLVSVGKVVLVTGVVQVLDGSVIGPRIVGESVGLHPVWVILALSVFGFFFGFVGLLLAVPLAVLLKLLLRFALERYQRSSLFHAPRA